MKCKTKAKAKITYFIIAILIFAFLNLINLEVNSEQTQRLPILINGNLGFNSINGVSSGDGTLNNPYIIENWNISSTANGIEIKNTDKYFVIRNCFVQSEKYGIYFDNVKNGKIDDINTQNGAYINNFKNGKIENSTIKNGIYFYNSEEAKMNNIIADLIYFNQSVNNEILNSNISNITFEFSDNNFFTNSTIYEISLANSKDNIAINSTFNYAKLNYNSRLIVKNYLEIETKDKNGNPIENAIVSAKDNGNEIFNGTTNSQGKISWILITDRIYNSNNATENSTTVYVSYENFTFNNNPRNVNMRSSHRETFSANEELLPDLALNANDISFSNENPIAGEKIKISAKIWNKGDLKAEKVVVKFYDNETFIGEFLIGEIYKNINEIAFVYWNATYGNHEIFVFVDEENNIKEKNENNNFAEKEIFVSEKPIQISISLSPKENAVDVQYENGAIIFNGTVYVNNIYSKTVINLTPSLTMAPGNAIPGNAIIDINEKELFPENGTNQNFSFMVNVTIPKGTPSFNIGKITVKPYINGFSVKNVSANATIKINQYYDVKIYKSGDHYKFKEINQKINCSFKIQNLGNGIDNFRIEITNMKDLEILILNKEIISDLAPMEYATYTLTLYATENATKNKNITIIIRVISMKSEEKGEPIYSEISLNATYETKEEKQLIIIATPNYGIYIISALMLTIVILSFFAGTEIGRVKLLMLFSALMTRIRRDDALDNFLRGRLYEFIKANPGVSFTDMLKTFEVGNGTLSYHLLILERTEYIKSQNDGLYKRYYPTGMKIKAKDINFLSDIQKAILEKIKANNGISQSKIANELGKSKRVVNYHIILLKDAEIIKVERKGFETKCYVNE